MASRGLDPSGTSKTTGSPVFAKGPAELARETLQNRRSRPVISSKAANGLSTVLMVVLVAQWIIIGVWGTAPTISEWHRYVQPLVWIPDWVWLVGILPLGVVGITLGIRSRRSGCLKAGFSILAMAVPFVVLSVSVWQREWKPGVSADSTSASRIIFLNASDPPRENAGGIIDAVEALDADLVVIVNPGWIAPAWRQRVAAGALNPSDGRSGSAATPWVIRWMTPILVASRGQTVKLRTVIRRGGIKAVRISLPEELSVSLGMSQVMVVDLPSDWHRSRTGIVKELGVAIQSDMDRRGEGVDLVLGDFNLTPRTRALASLLPGMHDLFVTGGIGWGATWPRENPVIRIDFALGGDMLGPTSVETFNPGTGGHRGLILEVKAPAEAEASR